MNTEAIGKFISAKRREKELTQFQHAEKLGITDRAVSKWERGKSLPDASIMLELCEILGISVNELLSGKVIDMKNYKEIAEKNLVEIASVERKKNKCLEGAQRFIGLSAVAVMLFMAVCGALIEEKNTLLSIIIIAFAIVYGLVCCVFATMLEHDSGYYECKNCGHRHIPKTGAIVFAVHFGTDRVLKCPECHKKGWHKKTLSLTDEEKQTEKSYE